MKKFILALMAIIAFAAASPGSASAAEVKLKTSLNNWSNGNEFTMTETESGSDIYTYDMPDAQSGMKFVIKVDHNDYKAKDSALQEVTLGTSYATAIIGGYDNNFQLKNSGALTFTYNLNDKTLVVTETTENNDPTPDTRTMSYKSDKQGWSSTQMTKGANYTWTHEVSGNDEFVIVAGTEELKHNAASVTVEFGTPYILYSGQGDNRNFKISGSDTYIVTVDASNKNNLTVTVTKKGTDTPDDPTPLVGQFRLRGSFDGWSDNGDEMFGNNNVWTITKTFNSGNTELAFRDTNGKKEYKSKDKIEEGMTVGTYYAADGGHAYTDYDGNNYFIKNAGTYVITFDATDKNNLRAKIELKNEGDNEDEVWSKTDFVYFNAGFDWERDTKINGRTLYAHFIKKGSNEPVAGKYRVKMLDNRDKEDNVNALLPLFYAPVPENYNDFWGVQFEVEDGSLVYNSTKSFESAKYDYENGNWFKFIYGCEKSVEGNTDGNVCRAEQSYVTYEQYKARRDDPNKEAIYYLGNNIMGRNGLEENSDWKELNFDGTMGISQRSEDVFMFQLKPQYSDKEVKFKMSWIDATGRMDEYNNGTDRYKDIQNGASQKVAGCDQRWWATFNLGLVGPTLAPKYKSLGEAEEAGDYKKTNDANDNGAMSYIPGRCRKYSRYNMYDWWIKPDQIKDGTYYVVIDTYYKTTALVSFKPAPEISKLEMGETVAYKETIDDEYALKFGDKLKGRKIHGATKIDKANTVTGTAVINTSEGISFWKDENNDGVPDYYLDYGLYYAETANPLETTEASEDNLLTTFRGIEAAKSYSAEVRNLPVGTSNAVKVGVRCTYTDNTNSSDGYEAKFRSFTNWKFTNSTVDIKTPSLDVEKNIAYRLEGKKWHAHVTGKLNTSDIDMLGLHYFFDVDDEQPSRHGVHLAESNEFQCQNGIAKAHYTSADQNWATVKDDRSVNFVIENIEMADTVPAEESYDSRFYIHVPFITGDLNPEVTWCAKTNGESPQGKLEKAQPARRRASAYAAPTTNMVFLSVPLTATTFVGKSLSGIADADVEAGASAEYYNLQGVRVEGDITPGVYIVRRGSKVTKEIVR